MFNIKDLQSMGSLSFQIHLSSGMIWLYMSWQQIVTIKSLEI